MSSTIRKMTICDVDQVYNLEPNLTKEMYYSFIENPKMVCRVLESNGEILGFTICKWELTLCYIVNIHVKYKSKGDGLKLMSHLVEECIMSDYIRYIGGEVRVSNTVNRNLCYKFGTVDHKIVPNYYDDGEDAVYMKKRIM